MNNPTPTQALELAGELIGDLSELAAHFEDRADITDNGGPNFAMKSQQIIERAITALRSYGREREAGQRPMTGTERMSDEWLARIRTIVTNEVLRGWFDGGIADELFAELDRLRTPASRVTEGEVAGVVDRLERTPGHGPRDADIVLSLASRLGEVEKENSEHQEAVKRWYVKLDQIQAAATQRMAELQSAESRLEQARAALAKIANWEMPPSGRFWDKEQTDPMSYGAAFGSNGERDYVKSVALAALSPKEQG